MKRRLLWATVVLALLGVAGWTAVDLWQRGFWYQPDAARFPTRGIDVSHHQGRIDWERVAKAEITFAYIKATEGQTWTDPDFADNWARAQHAGLATGAYHFFSFCSPGREQAEHFLSVLPVDDAMLPPALDVEFGGNCRAANLSTVHDEVMQWVEVVEARLGVKPVLYLTEDALDAFFQPREFEGVSRGLRLWYRSIFQEPRLRYPIGWSFWQYHPRGRVDGIDGPVDLNVFAGERTALPLRPKRR